MANEYLMCKSYIVNTRKCYEKQQHSCRSEGYQQLLHVHLLVLQYKKKK